MFLKNTSSSIGHLLQTENTLVKVFLRYPLMQYVIYH